MIASLSSAKGVHTEDRRCSAQNGKAKVKGLYSEKTGKTYDATVLLADTGGKYVNYRVERKG